MAHALLVMIYHVLKTGRPHQELGADSFDRLDAARLGRHHIQRLDQFGYTGTLASRVAA